AALETGVLADQLGTFPALSILGIGVASICSVGQLNWRKVLIRILAFPPTYALIAASLTRSFQFPLFISECLRKLGDLITPLALVSVGFQINFSPRVFNKNWKPLLSGLIYKLVLGPALIAFLFLVVLQASGQKIQITLVEAAMAPMIT